MNKTFLKPQIGKPYLKMSWKVSVETFCAMGPVEPSKFQVDGNFAYSVPWVSNIMPKRQFFEILTCLPIAGNTKQRAWDSPDHKLYILLNLLYVSNVLLSNHCKPKKNLSIDELLIATSCHISLILKLILVTFSDFRDILVNWQRTWPNVGRGVWPYTRFFYKQSSC